MAISLLIPSAADAAGPLVPEPANGCEWFGELTYELFETAASSMGNSTFGGSATEVQQMSSSPNPANPENGCSATWFMSLAIDSIATFTYPDNPAANCSTATATRVSGTGSGRGGWANLVGRVDVNAGAPPVSSVFGDPVADLVEGTQTYTDTGPCSGDPGTTSRVAYNSLHQASGPLCGVFPEVASTDVQSFAGKCSTDGQTTYLLGETTETITWRFRKTDCDVRIDSDGDSVGDCAEYDAGTDASDTDTDDDGVGDGADECGTVPGSPPTGCPEEDATIMVTLETDVLGDGVAPTSLGGAISGSLSVTGDTLTAMRPSGTPSVVTVAVPDGLVIESVRCDPGGSGAPGASGSTATLTIVPAAGGTTGCTVVVADYPSRYAPLVRLHPDESHRPMSADAFLAGSDLAWSANACADEHFEDWTPADLGSGTLSWGPGACGLGGPEVWFSTTDFTRPGDPQCDAEMVEDGHRCKSPELDETEGFFLDLDNSERDGASWASVTGGAVPAYYEYVPGSSITYWFNYGNSRPAASIPGTWLISHEGDWEHVVVHLDGENHPTGMTWYYHHWSSAGSDAAPGTWAEVPKEDGHPVVYAALEGHGSYWTPACDFSQPGTDDLITQTSDTCSDGGPRWQTWSNVVNAMDEPWYGFGGAWGQVGALSGDVPGVDGNTTGPPGPGSPSTGCTSCRERLLEEGPTFTDQIRSGTSFLYRGGGWPAGTPVVARLYSEPTLLGTAVAGEDGEVVVELQVPLTVPAGEHELQVLGNVATGVDRVVRSAVTISSAEGPFPDVPLSHPFSTEIAWLAGTGVATGYEDGLFRPLALVSRQAFAAYLYRLTHSGLDAPACETAPLLDVPTTNRFCGEIAWLASTEITTGYDDGTFRPSAPISRQAMAAFLHRFAGRPEFVAPAASPFTDVATDASFYTEIAWIADTTVTTGYLDGTFGPSTAVSRQAMAAFLFRFDALGLAPDN